MTNKNCAIQGCKMKINKAPPGVHFHSCPTSTEMRNKWLHALRNRCTLLDWSRSRICSKHFERKYFNSNRRLKKNAVPTLFPVINKAQKNNSTTSKLDVLLSSLSQAELILDVKNNLKRVKDPVNTDNIIGEDLKCRPDAPIEAHLWLLVKKQEHLNNRLINYIKQNNNQLDTLEKTVQNATKDTDQSLKTCKNIVKCLQDKLTALEDQIETFTAAKSR